MNIIICQPFTDRKLKAEHVALKGATQESDYAEINCKTYSIIDSVVTNLKICNTQFNIFGNGHLTAHNNQIKLIGRCCVKQMSMLNINTVELQDVIVDIPIVCSTLKAKNCTFNKGVDVKHVILENCRADNVSVTSTCNLTNSEVKCLTADGCWNVTLTDSVIIDKTSCIRADILRVAGAISDCRFTAGTAEFSNVIANQLSVSADTITAVECNIHTLSFGIVDTAVLTNNKINYLTSHGKCKNITIVGGTYEVIEDLNGFSFKYAANKNVYLSKQHHATIMAANLMPDISQNTKFRICNESNVFFD